MHWVAEQQRVARALARPTAQLHPRQLSSNRAGFKHVPLQFRQSALYTPRVIAWQAGLNTRHTATLASRVGKLWILLVGVV